MAFNKIVGPNSYSYSEPQVALVKRSSHGVIGKDLEQLVRRSHGRIKEAVDKMDHLPGEELIHLIAMGATERFGMNKNGDFFGRYALRRGHPTFVKNARWYYDHKSKDPRQSYGIVKWSTYHEPMDRVELIVALNATDEAALRTGGHIAKRTLEKLASGRGVDVSMGVGVSHDVCFVSGTPIETEAGLVPIEEIGLGERVRTHLGRFREVNSLFKRNYTGEIVRLTVSGLPEEVEVTANHPLWVVPKSAIYTCRGTTRPRERRRHTFRGSNSCSSCGTSVEVLPEWTAATEVKPGDYLVYPVERPGCWAPGRDLAYLMGVYAGDGSLAYTRRGRKRLGPKYLTNISLSLGTEQTGVIRKVQLAARALHGREQGVCPESGDKKAVICSIFDKTLAQMCSDHVGAGSWTKTLSRSVFKLDKEHRLAFLGGYLDSDGSVDLNHRYGCTRISTVNRRLADQVQKLFWGLGIASSVIRLTMTGGYTPGRICYQVTLGWASTEKLRGYSAKVDGLLPSPYDRGPNFLLGDLLYQRVTSVDKTMEERTVYNLSVAEDETYTVGGFVVHNCSYCKNKSTTPEDYCKGLSEGGKCRAGGLFSKMGKVVDVDGVAVALGADNPDPLNFHDISDVGTGADRTAKVICRLDKAAQAGRPVLDAEIAELTGYRLPSYLNAPDPTWSDLAVKLASWEDKLRSPEVWKKYAYSQPNTPPGPHLDSLEKLGNWLMGASRNHVIVPLNTFLDGVAYATNRAESSASIRGHVKQALSGIFSRHFQNDSWTDLFDERILDYVPNAPSHAGKVWSEKHASAYGFSDKPLQLRVGYSSLAVKTPEACFRKQAAVDPAAQILANAYACYQVQTLASWPENIRNRAMPFVVASNLVTD